MLFTETNYHQTKNSISKGTKHKKMYSDNTPYYNQ